MYKHILLIEDDAVFANALVRELDHSNGGSFEVEWVRRCTDALARLSVAAAIVSDLYLPDSRGMKTFELLFAAAPHVPILILVDAQYEQAAQAAVQRGAHDYLFKTASDASQLPKALRNMIARAAHSEILFNEKERAQLMLNSIADAVVSTDILGRVTYINARAGSLSGWSPEEAAGHPVEDVFRIIDATSRQITLNPMTLAIRENKSVALPTNCVLVRRDGTEAAIEDSTAPIRDRGGAVTGAIMVFHDVTAGRAMTFKMSYLAQHDSLTDLPNRVLLTDRVREAIALSGRHGRRFSVVVLDLDRFKHINDSLGHVVGDALLLSVAARLLSCVRTSDTVSRRGGDEFVVLLWEVAHSQDAAVAAEKILHAVRQPHDVDGHELHITASIGIVTYPEDGTVTETLIDKADFAMYHAKDCGRDNYQFFKPEMNALAIQRQSLEVDLRHAIARRELYLQYQSKVDLDSGTIIGVEALVRWRHPDRGPIPPAQLISIAEECGLIVPIGQWVLREACRQARSWELAGLPPMCMAVNISSVELRARGFVSNVRAVLAETALDPRHLELELTETVLMEDSKSAAEVLAELKEIGVRLALDDFGTGYSSLSYLKRFPIDTLKIDQSFVRDLTTDQEDAGIVAAVIGMGKSLHMRVIAEGVETREQLEFLQEHGCPHGQGFYFGRPVSASEFGQVLERHQSETAIARPLPVQARD